MIFVEDLLFKNIMAMSVNVDYEDAYDFIDKIEDFEKDIFHIKDDFIKIKINKINNTAKVIYRKYKSSPIDDDLNNLFKDCQNDVDSAWILKVLSRSGYTIIFEEKYSN